jgi:hypothetical protein
MLSSQLATVSGNYVAGPRVKGIKLLSFDVIYQVLTLAASLAQIGVTRTVFANGVAPAVTAVLPLAANGLPTAVSAQPTVTNVPLANPAYVAASDSEYLINLKLTAGATGTITVFGIVVKFEYNFA